MDILKHVLSLSGVDNEVIEKVISNETLKAIELPEGVAEKVKSSLLTVELAKQHPDIANHFKGTNFGVIDESLKSALSGVGFSDEDIQSLFSGKKSKERVAEAIAKVHESAKKSVSGTLDSQLQELRDAMKVKEEEYKKGISLLENESISKTRQIEKMVYNDALGKALASSNLKFKDLGGDLLQVNANHLINQKLEELQAVPKVVGGKIKLFRADDQESEHHTGAERTDFYSLLPSIVDPIVDKTQKVQKGSFPIQGGAGQGNSPKTRALAEIKKKMG